MSRNIQSHASRELRSTKARPVGHSELQIGDSLISSECGGGAVSAKPGGMHVTSCLGCALTKLGHAPFLKFWWRRGGQARRSGLY